MVHIFLSFFLFLFKKKHFLSSFPCLALPDKWPAEFSKGRLSFKVLSLQVRGKVKAECIGYVCTFHKIFLQIVDLMLMWLQLKCAKKSRLQEVNLEAVSSFLSWWKIVHFDPQERLEYEGQPVPVSFSLFLKIINWTVTQTSSVSFTSTSLALRIFNAS